MLGASYDEPDPLLLASFLDGSTYTVENALPEMPTYETWTYSSNSSSEIVECAYWAGDAAPHVDAHFHDDDQITIVLSGSRLFSVNGTVFHVATSEYLVIPAGEVHQSLRHTHSGTQCLNLYVRADISRGAAVQGAIPNVGSLERSDPSALLRMIRTSVEGWSMIQERSKSTSGSILANDVGPIVDVATRHGLSREAFTRKFARETGMPPHSYRIAAKLNDARRLLREGTGIADTAAGAGFADQSHLGRLFRRAFGASPGRYRKGFR
jgi:AraC-like DNA-binding protein/mannose-6-phosphate isomerase-like protein (cupin superfamily)